MKTLNEIDLTTAAIVGGLAVAAKLMYEKYKKAKTLKSYGIEKSKRNEEIVPNVIDVKDIAQDAFLLPQRDRGR